MFTINHTDSISKPQEISTPKKEHLKNAIAIVFSQWQPSKHDRLLKCIWNDEIFFHLKILFNLSSIHCVLHFTIGAPMWRWSFNVENVTSGINSENDFCDGEYVTYVFFLIYQEIHGSCSRWTGQAEGILCTKWSEDQVEDHSSTWYA